jgi:hypothetical protein
METAKDLAFKLWEHTKDGKIPTKEHFENWWSQWVYIKDHKDSLEPKHNVYVDGHRYIKLD